MFKTDFILRAIEEVVRAITRAKDQRAAGEHTQARNTLDRALEDLTGLPLRSIVTMPVQSALDLLSGSSALDPAKTLLVAQILFECGLSEEEPARRRSCFAQALRLYDEVTQRVPECPEIAEHETSIAALIQNLEIC